jgi:hypothetical protein
MERQGQTTTTTQQHGQQPVKHSVENYFIFQMSWLNHVKIFVCNKNQDQLDVHLVGLGF